MAGWELRQVLRFGDKKPYGDADNVMVRISDRWQKMPAGKFLALLSQLGADGWVMLELTMRFAAG